jgi:phospholipid/cholesterol/gamma-HCH transport system substrate-binding protein
VTSEFKKTGNSVNQILDKNQANINKSLTNLSKTSANFAKISDTLSKAKIGQAIKSLEQSLKGVDRIITNLEQGKGTMGKLLTDDQLYKNLNQTSSELELLLQDLRLNPTRYINVSLFGKKNKPYISPQPKDTISN